MKQSHVVTIRRLGPLSGVFQQPDDIVERVITFGNVTQLMCRNMLYWILSPSCEISNQEFS